MKKHHVTSFKRHLNTPILKATSRRWLVLYCSIFVALSAFAFHACTDYQSENVAVFKQAQTLKEKALLGDALIHVDYEAESIAWGEVVDKTDLLPGPDDMLDGVNAMYVSRVKNTFKLFKDGKFTMTVEKREPIYMTEPTIIHNGIEQYPTPQSVRWIMTNDNISSFDENGNLVNSISAQIPPMLGLANALKGGCDKDNINLLALPMLTMNGDATDMLTSCLQDAVIAEKGASIQRIASEGIILYKRKLSALSMSGSFPTDNIMPTSYTPARRHYNRHPHEQIYYLERTAQLQTTQPPLEEEDKLGNMGKVIEGDVGRIGDIMKSKDYANCELVTVVDSANLKVLGTYTTSPDGDQMIMSSTYEYPEEDQGTMIRSVLQEKYTSDLASGANIIQTRKIIYDNVHVLTQK